MFEVIKASCYSITYLLGQYFKCLLYSFICDYNTLWSLSCCSTDL